MSQTKNIRLSDLETNKGQIKGVPKNPRFVKDSRFKALVKSIESDPEFLDYRTLLVYPFEEKFVIICGNVRYRACKEIGYKELPCYVLSADTTPEKLRAYAIKDNENYGQYDFDMLANEWDADELSDFGVELPDLNFDLGNDESGEGDSDNDTDDEQQDEDSVRKPIILDILFPSDNDFEIPCLLKERMAGRLELPVTPWGANSRLTVGVNTYHFYVDDYRFEALFKDPANLVASGCKAIVEPNCSLHDQTPIAFGLQQIYKKRWLARYMQEVGVDVYVDLNVAPKFAEYNTLGVPEGWDAFFTRGLTGQVESLKIDLETARRISGKQTPNLIVYGDGKEAEKFCQKNGLLYVTDFINAKKN